ncbi:DsrE family protein [Paenirhodobacter sp.]|uniref:DsrE family protein n=1 Tax=Paenirhodobacter sp. TaxID=1965326 RepID=UPI003B3CA333
MKTVDFVTTLFDGAANPAKVTVAFNMARNAQKKGLATMIVLMVQGVELGLPGATEGIDVGQPFEPVKDMLAAFLADGGRIGICKSCMIYAGFTEDQIDPACEVITAPDIIDLLTTAKGSLQIT